MLLYEIMKNETDTWKEKTNYFISRGFHDSGNIPVSRGITLFKNDST